MTSKGDMSGWSQNDLKKLLNRILVLGGNTSKKSYRAVESSINWKDVKVGAKSGEECKAMYQKLISKVRKYRTMKGIIRDVFPMITEGKIKTAVNGHPHLPKRPLTAFSLFVSKRSKKVSDFNKVNSIKMFASEWKELSEEKKEVYKKKYMKRKKKYDEDLDIFRQSHPEYQFSSVVPISRPQPPLPSKLFLESRLEKMKNKKLELSNAETVRNLMDKYKNLSDKKKLKWINRARDCAQTYQEQCEQYLTHHPKSSTKLELFYLSEEEQRIWYSSRGKPVSVPPQNLFMYFCQTRRDTLLHLPISEQSKELSTIYLTLTEHELKDLEEKFKQEVEEYVNSYTQYYQSLSEEERGLEQSPDDVLAVYYKILRKDHKNKKKKQKMKDTLTEADEKQVKFSDKFPQPDVGADIPHDDSNGSPHTPVKRKSLLHEDSVIRHKKKKRKSEHDVSPSSPRKEGNHFDIASPRTNISVVNEADTLLSTWPSLKTKASENNMMYLPPSKIGTQKITQEVETTHQITGSGQTNVSDVTVDMKGIKKKAYHEHPDMPKRPLTAFSLFVKKRSKKLPDISGINRMKVFASEWNELSEEKKEVYKKKYMKLKKKYDEDLDIFRQNHPEYQISSTVLTSHPEYQISSTVLISRPEPPLPSTLFVESRLDKVKSKHPELNHAEAIEKLMDKYKKLSDGKKLTWINRAKDSAQTYQEQCELYLARHPKSSTKLGSFSLSNEEQRIWQSSRGKPASAPPQNLFMYFCDTRRDASLHLTISEQSKELSAIYHKLTEDELKDIETNFIKEVEEYVNSYTQYYQSLSEGEKGLEQSPEDALAVYYKILRKDHKNKKKKQKMKDTLTEADENQVKFSDLLPQPDVSTDIPHDDSNGSPHTQEQTVTPINRKSLLHEDSLILHKKKKRKSEHDVSSSSCMKENHTGLVSPRTNMSVHDVVSEADSHLSMVSPRETEILKEKMICVPPLKIGACDKRIKQEVETTQVNQNGHIELKPFFAEYIKQEQEQKMFYGSFNTEDVNIKNIRVESMNRNMSEMEIIGQPNLYGKQGDGMSEHTKNKEAVSEERTQPVVIATCTEIYKCHFCGVEFDSNGQLEEHQIKHVQKTDDKCDISGVRFFFNEGLTVHKRIHTGEKPYKCDVCGVSFAVSGNLKIHKRIHTGEKPYKCDVCSVSFAVSGNLIRHKRIHTEEKPYKCDVCSVSFAVSGTLIRHKRIHTEEKPYKCDVCSVSFTVSGNLIRHRRIHTGEKPYKCDVCSASFAGSGDLIRHKRIHTGEKPYTCHVCGTKFSQSGSLRMHQRLHTEEKPYKCDVCGVPFSNKGNLKRHQRTHTRIKPYKCDACGTTFSQNRSLKNHKRLHTGEKPYKCDVCNVSFSTKEKVKRHQRKHTGEKH